MMTFVLNYDVETNQNISLNFILTHANTFKLSVHKTLKSYCLQQNCDILIHEHNIIQINWWKRYTESITTEPEINEICTCWTKKLTMTKIKHSKKYLNIKH